MIRILFSSCTNEQIFAEYNPILSGIVPGLLFINGPFVEYNNESNSIAKAKVQPFSLFGTGHVIIGDGTRIITHHCNNQIELVTVIADGNKNTVGGMKVYNTPTDEMIMDIVTALMEG